MKIAIIDYETGNLKSVSKALELASNNVLKKSNIEIINSAKDLNNFDKVVLPGQGSFKQCFQSLNSIHGILDRLTDFVTVKKKPILGICVGMQLFANFGDEDGGSDGLGWIKGKVKKISLVDKSWILKLEIKNIKFLKYLEEKASISINGVSLTISKIFNKNIILNIIPHTLKLTNLKNLRLNDTVNVELDIFGKYIYKYTK